MKGAKNTRRHVILMADDDPDCHLIVQSALEEVSFRGVFESVTDGKELMDFLLRRGKHRRASRPDLIILDLNMAEEDGRLALREIKKDPSLSKIPVLVLTFSIEKEDEEFCKRYRRCSYMQKPSTFREWAKGIEDALRSYIG